MFDMYLWYHVATFRENLATHFVQHVISIINIYCCNELDQSCIIIFLRRMKRCVCVKCMVVNWHNIKVKQRYCENSQKIIASNKTWFTLSSIISRSNFENIPVIYIRGIKRRIVSKYIVFNMMLYNKLAWLIPFCWIEPNYHTNVVTDIWQHYAYLKWKDSDSHLHQKWINQCRFSRDDARRRTLLARQVFIFIFMSCHADLRSLM